MTECQNISLLEKSWESWHLIPQENRVPIAPCSNREASPGASLRCEFRSPWAGRNRPGPWVSGQHWDRGGQNAHGAGCFAGVRRRRFWLVSKGGRKPFVLGKVPHGGHCAAGDHALPTMMVGPLRCSANDLGWHVQEVPIYVISWSKRVFRGFSSLYNSSVSTMRVEEEQFGESRSAAVQPSSLSHHQALASSSLKVPQALNKSSEP